MITTLDVGGAEVQLLRRVRLLREAGVDVTVCSLVSGSALAPEFARSGVEVIELDSASLFDPRPALALWRTVRRGRFHVVHCHLFRARLWGVPAARLALAPLVVQTEHSLTASHYEGRPHGAANRLAGVVLGRLSHRTVAISADTARALRRIHRVPAGRIVHVPNGVPAEAFAGEAAAADPVVDVVALGRLQPQKGFLDLVRAVGLLRESGDPVTCEIAGEGPLEGELRREIESRGLAELVRLVGTMRDPLEFIRRGRVFAMPSRWEPFGIAALEAMAAGVPVVASSVDALPELIEDGETGLLVPAGQPTDLAAAVRALVASPETRSRLAANARTAVRRFDLSSSTERLIELYSTASGRA